MLLTLARWHGFGFATPIDRPAGRFVRRRGNATVQVKNFRFSRACCSIPRGGQVRWRFRGDRIHDATMVRGPRGFATATIRQGTQSHRFIGPRRVPPLLLDPPGGSYSQTPSDVFAQPW